MNARRRAPVRGQGPPAWAGEDSNLRTTDYESAALTAELPARPVGEPRSARRGLVDRGLELGGGDGALEAGGDGAVAVDDERPGLGLQAPLEQLRPQALVGLVVLVDLLVDEGGLVAHLAADLLGDVDDRAADPALAERGRGEDQD